MYRALTSRYTRQIITESARSLNLDQRLYDLKLDLDLKLYNLKPRSRFQAGDQVTFRFSSISPSQIFRLIILFRDAEIEIERQSYITTRFKVSNIIQFNILLKDYSILEKYILINKYIYKDKKIVSY